MYMESTGKTGREGQIIVLAAEGLTDKQIAAHLGIGVETVGTYWKRILGRFASSSRTEVIAKVLRQQADAETETLRKEIERRRVAEVQLESAVARLSTLVGSMEAGVVLFNEDVQVIYANDRFCHLFGVRDARDLVGDDRPNLIDAIRPAFVDPEEMEECMYESVSGGVPRRGRRHLLKSGRIVQSDYSPTISDTHTRGHLFQVRDITTEVSEGKLAALLARIAPTLISSIGHNTDEAIEYALREVGVFAKAERSYVFVFDNDAGTVSNTHEWVSAGVTSRIGALQDIPQDDFPWWMDHMKRHEPLVVNSVADLPPQAAPEKQLLNEIGVKSIVVLPLRGQLDECIGFVGFEDLSETRVWEKWTTDLLISLGDMLAATLLSNAKTAGKSLI